LAVATVRVWAVRLEKATRAKKRALVDVFVGALKVVKLL
jgi:hypothetical protein